MIVASPYQRYIMLGTIAATVFVVYAFFPWATMRQTSVVFNSPDETANYFFTREWASGSGLATEEALNEIAHNIIHPRSVTVSGASLVPASFIGLPVLYGSAALLGSVYLLPYLGAVITVIALFALYQCWRAYFDERVSLVAIALAAFHPAWWYFASRPFYHNVLFFDLFIFGWWGYERFRVERDNESLSATKQSLEWLGFAAACIALAMFVRASEAIWVIPLIALVWYRDRRHWNRQHLLVVAIVVLAFGAIYSLVQSFGGGAGGYQVPVLRSTSYVGQWWQYLLGVFIPFGFHPVSIANNFFYYGLLLFWPVTVLTLVGLKNVFSFKIYALGSILVTVLIVVYYGSAVIRDSVGFEGVTIGNSFVRYWLPVYIAWLPFAALAVLEFMRFIRRSIPTRLGIMIALFVIWGWSFHLVYFDRSEGLVHVAARLTVYREIREYVKQVTGEEAIIVSDQSDKLFFPERRVVTPGDRPFWTYAEVLAGLPPLTDVVPVYIYLEGRLDPAMQVTLAERRLVLSRPISLPNGARLYPLLRQ